MQTKHTFLCEEGTWDAHGHYTDEKMNTIKVDGTATFTLKNDVLINESVMRLLLDSPIEIKNVYEIKPFEPKADTTTFSSLNPAIGKLIGTLTIVGDMILQVYHSQDFVYAGCECITRLHDTCYKSSGVFLKGNQKLSSWSVQLQKKGTK